MESLRFSLMILFVLAAALFACTAGDDDDDAADDDTVVDDDDASDDDDSGDDDTSDDDYPLGECTNIADEVLPLPACSPYEEKAPWIETDSHYYAPGFYSGSVAQKPVTATVDLRLGGRFRLVNDDGELKLRWAREDRPVPLSDGQTVKVFRGGSAGDDGCCDTTDFFIMNEFGKLIIGVGETTGFAVGYDFLPETGAPMQRACRYEGEGKPVPSAGENQWYIGLSIAGQVEGDSFASLLPGNTSTTGGGTYEINFPYAYQYYDCEAEDYTSGFTMRSLVEVVAVE